MKVGRRGFFGIMGGAAAAGPSLAKGVAHGSFASGAPMPIGASGNAVGVVSEADWKTKCIAELRSIISGNDPQADRNRKMARMYSAEKQEEFRLDALRSVSMTARHRMFVEGVHARRERIRRVDAEFDLADWLAGKFG
jgi:hypothetical protein